MSCQSIGSIEWTPRLPIPALKPGNHQTRPRLNRGPNLYRTAQVFGTLGLKASKSCPLALNGKERRMLVDVVAVFRCPRDADDAFRAVKEAASALT
jgi:hypothetical protein